MTNENKNENVQNKPNVVTIIVAIIIAVTLLFYFFTFQVRITEKAVVTTFGKPTKVIDPSNDSGAGLYWKWPYPFQKVNIFDARMRIFTGTLEQIFTSDSKSIILQTYTGAVLRVTMNTRGLFSTPSIDFAMKKSMRYS